MVSNRKKLEDLLGGQGLGRSYFGEKPFEATPELIDTAFRVAGSCSSYEKAHNLYLWMRDNVSYDESKFHYRSASQVFRDKEGICVCQAFLYTTMARIVGLDSSFVDVKKDDSGKKVDHACSSVFIGGSRILVDTCRRNGFGIQHRKSFVWSDEKVRESYGGYFGLESKNYFVSYQPNENIIGGLIAILAGVPLVIALTGSMLWAMKDISEGRTPSITKYVKEKAEYTRDKFDSIKEFYDSISENLEDEEQEVIKSTRTAKLSLRDRIKLERELRFPIIVHRLEEAYPDKDFSGFNYNEGNYAVALRMYTNHVKSKLAED